MSHAGAAMAASKGEAKVLAAVEATPPVALVRSESRSGGLNVIPMAPEQIEAQVLDLTRQVAQRVGRGGGVGTASTAGAAVSRLEVSLGAADARLRLAPCDKIQAYVPEGANLWGRSRVGLRCEQGAVRWNVYVPVTVRVLGLGVVPAINLTPGSRIEAADLRVAEVDLAADGSPAVLSPDEAVGRLVARSVQAGQSLRQQHLKAKRYFAAGDPVRLIVKGPGFSVNGEGEAVARALNPRTFTEFLNDERGIQAVKENLPGWQRHTAITGKEPPAGVIQLVETRFETGHTDSFMNKGWWRKTPLRALADPLIAAARQAQDRSFRYGLYMAKFDQNIADAIVRFRGMTRMRAERVGADPEAWVRAVEDLGDTFSGDDVFKALGDERLARDWRELSSRASRDAHDRVNRLLFSYKMTGADNALRRATMYHYWLSRAFPLYARTALRNPWLLGTYLRAWDAMQREAEQNGYPPNLRGFTRMMGDATGMYGLVNPVQVLVPFGMLVDQAKDDESTYDFLKRWGFYFNPLIEMAAASLGWTDRAPDLTQTYAVRRAMRATVNWLNSNGLEDAVPDWLADPHTIADDDVARIMTGIADKANAGLRWLTNIGGGNVNWIDDFAGTDSNAYESDVVQSILLDQAEARFGPMDRWTDAQWEEYQQAWDAIHLGRDGNDLADAAVESYADERMKGTALGMVTPGGVLQRYGPRDADLAGAQAGRAKFGTSTPLTPEEQRAVDRRQLAASGSMEDVRLDHQQDEYAGIGTPNQRALADGWRAIAYPDLSKWDPSWGVSLNGQWIPLQKIAALDDGDRKALADAWVASVNGTDELKAYRAERDKFVADNPEYAGFDTYKDLAFNYEGGVRAFRTDRAKANPNFRRELKNYEADLRKRGIAEALIPAELDQWATSLAGYKAAEGIKNSAYDEDPTSTGDQATVDTLIRSGAVAGSGGSSTKAPKSTAQKVRDDLFAYQQDAAVFDAVLQNAGIGGGFANINNPLAVQMLQANFGDLVPTKSKLLDTYLMWKATIPKGQDDSPEAFARVVDRVQAAA